MSLLDRRSLLAGSAATSLLLGSRPSLSQDTPGVSATEIKIGSTASLSGPVSALGTIAKCQAAYFDMVNEAGGIGGRKIKFIYYDDGFSPPKTVEQVRRLIESDNVAFLFSTLGTSPNSAIVKYVNTRKVPHLFLTTNGDKWGDYKSYPYTMAFAPSSRTEAKVFAKHALAEKPDAKFALLYQNDDFGKDFIDGLRDILGDRYNASVTAASYEITDATVDSQLISLKGSNADYLITGATAKFGTQSIRKVYDLGWKVKHFVTMGASSVVASIIPAGVERAKGIVTSAFLKDSSDPAYAADPAMKAYNAFMAKHYAAGNPHDGFNTFAYTVTKVMCHVLEQCKGDFRRETIMREASSIKDLEVPLLLPGIKVNTSPTNHHPLRQVRLMRWDGERWNLFGGVIADSSI